MPEGETQLTSTLLILQNLHGSEEQGNKDDRAEKADWRHILDSLVAVSITGCGRRRCHHYDQWPLHEATLLQYMGHMGNTWLDFSSHYSSI